jgi:hypothetical protein
MNLSMQCCCETELGDCDDSCDCATSYTIDGLQGTYRYESELDYGGAWTCASCPGQQGCSVTWWGIDLGWTLVGTIVMTRSADPSGTGCIYTGTGTVLVTGSLDYTYKWECNDLEGCPAFDETQTFNFSTETCVCVTVRCEANLIGAVPGCNGSIPGAAWRHTVEIGDFIVTCSAELWTDSGCDPICPVKGQPPVALRCQGGAVDYLTPLVCLDTLLAADFLCAGYRNGPVSSYCFSTVGAAASRGPFGVEEEGECSVGQDDFPCLDTSQSATGVSLWHTSFYAPPTQPLCGSWSISQNICNGTIRREANQSGCTPVGAPISYA